MKLACVVVNNQRLTIDYDEAQSCAFVGLVESAKRFDPSRSVSFKAFAYRRIAGEIIDHCRRNSFVRRRGIEKGIKFDMVSASSWGDDQGHLLIDQIPGIEDDPDLKMDFEAALKTLTSREQQVMLAFASGAKGREVAAELGVTESRVSQIASEARSKLEREMA